jgi:hypothetical protein
MERKLLYDTRFVCSALGAWVDDLNGINLMLDSYVPVRVIVDKVTVFVVINAWHDSSPQPNAS